VNRQGLRVLARAIRPGPLGRIPFADYHGLVARSPERHPMPGALPDPH
jgi:hypothetical protein